MDFDYVVADPTGNITVLIRSPYTAETRQNMILEAFMREPSCEQAGFIMPLSDSAIRLEMMGHEFCGHATLSAAAYLARETGLAEGEEAIYTVDSSGVDTPLDVRIKRLTSEVSANGAADHSAVCSDPAENGEAVCESPVYQGTVSMPKPEVTAFRGYPLVCFGGIAHLIVPAEAFTDEQAESAVREYAAELEAPALGMMLCPEYDRLTGDGRQSTEAASAAVTSDDRDQFSIRPLVYVPGSETLFWEHGCATGSTALGWYRYSKDNRHTSTIIKQPGGIIRVDVTGDELNLTGRVFFRPASL